MPKRLAIAAALALAVVAAGVSAPAKMAAAEQIDTTSLKTFRPAPAGASRGPNLKANTQTQPQLKANTQPRTGGWYPKGLLRRR